MLKNEWENNFNWKNPLQKIKYKYLYRHWDRILEASMNFINFLTSGFRLWHRVWDVGVLENPCQLSDWKESANFKDLVQIVLSLCNQFYEWSSALNSNHSIFCCTLEGISSPDNVCNINGPTTAGITKQRSGVCQQPWALFFAVLCTWASDLRLFKLTIQEWW